MKPPVRRPVALCRPASAAQASTASADCQMAAFASAWSVHEQKVTESRRSAAGR